MKTLMIVAFAVLAVAVWAQVGGQIQNPFGLVSSGNIGFTGGKGQHIVTQAAASDTAGTVTLAAGAGSLTFTTAYTSAPVCTCTDTTAAAAVKCSTTTTVLSITGTTTDVIAYHCVGNPN